MHFISYSRLLFLLSPSRNPLQVWFQNARAKWRRMMMKQEGKAIDGEKGEGSIDLDTYNPHSPSYMLGPPSPTSMEWIGRFYRSPRVHPVQPANHLLPKLAGFVYEAPSLHENNWTRKKRSAERREAKAILNQTEKLRNMKSCTNLIRKLSFSESE